MFRTITLGLMAVLASAASGYAEDDDHDHGHRRYRGGYGHHNHGHHNHGGYRYNSGYRQSFSPRVQIYGNWNRGPIYHDTSHYDYHPPTVVPHGNHYHVIPGHYDYHQTGHYHW